VTQTQSIVRLCFRCLIQLFFTLHADRNLILYTITMATMFRYFQVLVGLLATVTASPLQLQSRAIISHDSVVGFTQAVPSGTVGSVYLAYKPYLYVVNGCVPFPAVDAAGNTG
jgi:hypothetical protein